MEMSGVSVRVGFMGIGIGERTFEVAFHVFERVIRAASAVDVRAGELWVGRDSVCVSSSVVLPAEGTYPYLLEIGDIVSHFIRNVP